MRSAEAVGPWLRDMHNYVAPPGTTDVPAGPVVDSVDVWLRGGGPWYPPLIRAQMVRRSRPAQTPSRRFHGLVNAKA